jgi:hypothetical protein
LNVGHIESLPLQLLSVIARLVRATQFLFSKKKMGRPHKAGDDGYKVEGERATYLLA